MLREGIHEPPTTDWDRPINKRVRASHVTRSL